MPSVLVIDDEPAVRESMRQVLTRTGFEVVTADNGDAGVEAYFEHPTDVVIVDIIMPRTDCIVVIKQIRARYTKARILVMTSGCHYLTLGYEPTTLVTDAYLT